MNETLLRLLEDNARLTNDELAAMTGMTPDAVAAELAALRKAGVILGYKTIVDWEKTDRDLCTARIEIKVTPKSGMGFEEIAETIARFEEVQSVYLMSGGYDLAVTVNGKSFKEVALFVAHRLAPLDSVESTATHFVLKKYKEKGVLAAGQPEDQREAMG